MRVPKLTEPVIRQADAVLRIKGRVFAAALREALRGELAPHCLPTGARQRLSVMEFAQKYFPHHCNKPPSQMHRELCEQFDLMLSDEDGRRLAIAAPRGNAKSTYASLILPLYCIAYQLKRYIVIISDTATQATQFLADLKAEIEDNIQLRNDFLGVVAVGPQWTQDEIVTMAGTKVLALGTGKRIRGRKMRQYRPDLVIIDDLESDEHVRNLEQRNKVHDWLTKAVLKARGVGTKFDVVMVGTVLHMDSVLARLLNPAISPGWRSKKYRSVITWALRQDLWDEWQRRYTDISRADDDRIEEARKFYLAHQAEMDEGADVLWPEGESYYDLMCLLVNEGRASFDSEKQNDPISSGQCFFDENRIEWFSEESAADGRIYLRPDRGEKILLSECDIFGACDPSLGKHNKSGDPSAIVSIAAWPARRLGLGGYRSYWVLDCDMRLRRPSQLLQDILAAHRRRRYRRFGIEAVQFQEFFADEVQKVALGTEGLEDLAIIKLYPLGDKAMRIEKLEPFFYGGKLRLNRALISLWTQLRYFPHADHDDGPDAVELAMETIGAIQWSMVTTEADMAATTQAVPHPERVSGIVRQIVRPSEEAVSQETCATCMHRVEKIGRAYCSARMFFILPTDPACTAHEAVGGQAVTHH